MPTAYALNRTPAEGQVAHFSANSAAVAKVVEQKAAGYGVLGNPRPAVTLYVSQHKINEGTYPSVAALIQDIAGQVERYGTLATTCTSLPKRCAT